MNININEHNLKLVVVGAIFLDYEVIILDRIAVLLDSETMTKIIKYTDSIKRDFVKFM
jgi:hypothetical protein